MSTPPSMSSTSRHVLVVDSPGPRREVPGELAWAEPLQLQLDTSSTRSSRRPRVAPRRRCRSPAVVLRRAAVLADGTSCRGRSSPRDAVSPATARVTQPSDHRTRWLHVLLSPRGSRGPPRGYGPLVVSDALQEDGDQVEHQPEQAGAEHVGPRHGVLRGRQVRRDAVAEPVLRAAEVLGDEGRDDRGRGGDLERGEQVRHGVGDARLAQHLDGDAAYERSSSRWVGLHLAQALGDVDEHDEVDDQRHHQPPRHLGRAGEHVVEHRHEHDDRDRVDGDRPAG